MSEENVKRAHMAINAVNSRDLDALMSLMDEEVESVSRIVAIEGGLRGHEGVRTWWDSWFAAFPDYTLEVVEIRDLGDVLLGRLRAIGHGRESDLPVQDEIFQVSHWRDGKCVRWEVVYTEAQALEAAGLSDG
jgi:ketosteroid isomerase-like protein